MTYSMAVILGIVQGLTEFLPVSSSAHLVIVEYLMGMRNASENITFDILLHLATVVAVIWFYRKDLVAILTGKFVGEGPNQIPKWRLLGFLALSVIATGVAMPFKGVLEDQFASITGVRIFLIINGIALAVLPSLRKSTKGLGQLTWIGALIIGLVQAVAVLPGISRSGWTIMAGLILGLSPREACRYSFLLSIPTILITAVVKAPDMLSSGVNIGAGPAVLGFIVAIAGALAAIPLMIGTVERGKLWGFAIYCVIVGVALFFV
jgi:undecaprenyl-diphosphatase